jgi:CelD/BcsL family acetyltransferase involved in cellulose biosynthesis
VRIEWVSESTVEKFADIFFELHKARWISRGLPGAFFGKAERFQREWMHKAAQDQKLWMSVMFAEGKPVGCVYAMRHEKTCYFYQAGMDPSATNLSPGTILVSQTISRAIDEGCTEFDFMRGDEPYKRRWNPTRERTNYRILMPPTNVITGAGYQWNKAAWRVESKIRDRVEGKSLRPSKSAPKDVS